MPAACVQSWIDEHQGKHICQCGCGESIPINKWTKGNGIPRFKRWHYKPSQPVIDNWVQENQGKHICACGCGLIITITRHHRDNGIPKFIHHHDKGLRSVWIKQQQGLHHCQCGCGVEISIIGDHKKRGIPRFILGHNAQGAGNPAWRGGMSQTYATRRRILVPDDWRIQVLQRDGFRCALGCRKDSPDPLHAHHIIGFAKQPELAGKVWNGITLCEPCHYSIKGREAEHEDLFFNLLSEN